VKFQQAGKKKRGYGGGTLRRPRPVRKIAVQTPQDKISRNGMTNNFLTGFALAGAGKIDIPELVRVWRK